MKTTGPGQGGPYALASLTCFRLLSEGEGVYAGHWHSSLGFPVQKLPLLS